MQYDILAIGDTAIDDFIRLKDARVNCDINDEHCLLCLRFGDKVPFEFSDVVPGVGNSANAAVCCARLGLSSALHAYVGDDSHGKDCIETLRHNGVATELIVAESGKHTNYHYVLWYESERTILIRHEVFSYSIPTKLEPPKWVYLSSMADKTISYHEEISRYLAAHPSVKVAFQPGTFQIKLGADALKELYAQTEIFFCNKEEAHIILKTDQTAIKPLLEGIRALGCAIAVITDGREGACAMDATGAWHVPMFPDPKPPLERTGAGDATSATTVAYMQLGYPLAEALMRGMINSMSVVQEIGAQKGLLNRDQIEDWYDKRPPDFKPTAM